MSLLDKVSWSARCAEIEFFSGCIVLVGFNNCCVL